MELYKTLDIKDYLLFNLLALDGSTTFFLETSRGMDLHVEIESQVQEGGMEDGTIQRITRLYFLTPEMPALYCVSTLNRRALTDSEYRCLIHKEIPIGRIFTNLNDPLAVLKRNISIAMGTDKQIAASLNVSDCMVYRKQYDYWVNKRKIGLIMEFFNEESLKR